MLQVNMIKIERGVYYIKLFGMPKVKIKIVWQRKCNKNKKCTKYFIVVLGLTSGHALVTSMTVFTNQQSTTSGELTTDLSSPYITEETYSTYPPIMTSKVDLESATFVCLFVWFLTTHQPLWVISVRRY